MASQGREEKRSVGLQRLTLLAFAGLLVLLFLIFAVVQGLGNPSVSSGDVAVVEDAPDGLGTVSEEDLKRAIEQAAGQAGQKVPKEGTPQYDELEKTAFTEVLDRIWIQGEAADMGISVTPEEVSDELEKLKKQAFKTEAQYQKFLKESNFTPADVDERIKIQMLSERIQKEASEESATPSDAEVEEYYEAAKDTQFTQPETRDVRLIVNKDRKKIDEAAALLDKDNSDESWKKVAKEFSTESATKGKGGLRTSLVEGTLPDLDSAIFSAPPATVEGPVKSAQGWTIFEVDKVNPEKVQSLKEVESQINAQLGEQVQQQASARLIRNYGSKWTSRTFCADDFLIERCANFEGTGRPASAPPACYEADPKGPAPEACPAPVQQVAPALPGTVSVLAPEGEKLPQRPRPSKLEAAPPTGTTGLPPGVTGE
ncbi:MAG TPA: peptidyl-prolyl cis-trans isomerase [Solirubrobacterales bacterium]|nr:peptidyl-prolyl cis-trans isomerase [Solirubrobacterales bacterium]